MRVSVAEMPDEDEHRMTWWDRLRAYIAATPTDLLVLPELPFCRWQPFTAAAFDRSTWDRVVGEHDRMQARLGELGAPLVAGSRPLDRSGRRLNCGFVWSAQGCEIGHAKCVLPDEPDGRETTWFDHGPRVFEPIRTPIAAIGFQICTELLFTDIAHATGRAGAEILVAPRATGGHERWRLAARLAAILAGAFVLTANRRSAEGDAFAGRGWIVSPEGEVLAATDRERPFVSATIDLSEARRAKASYPRNLPVAASRPTSRQA